MSMNLDKSTMDFEKLGIVKPNAIADIVPISVDQCAYISAQKMEEYKCPIGYAVFEPGASIKESKEILATFKAEAYARAVSDIMPNSSLANQKKIFACAMNPRVSGMTEAEIIQFRVKEIRAAGKHYYSKMVAPLPFKVGETDVIMLIDYPVRDKAMFRVEFSPRLKGLPLDLIHLYIANATAYKVMYTLEIQQSGELILDETESMPYGIWGHELSALSYNGGVHIATRDNMIVCSFDCDSIS